LSGAVVEVSEVVRAEADEESRVLMDRSVAEAAAKVESVAKAAEANVLRRNCTLKSRRPGPVLASEQQKLVPGLVLAYESAVNQMTKQLRPSSRASTLRQRRIPLVNVSVGLHLDGARWLLCLLVVLIASLAQAAERPNILFMMSDDQNWAGLSVPMHPDIDFSKSSIVQTPNLEKLAAQGMLARYLKDIDAQMAVPNPQYDPQRAPAARQRGGGGGRGVGGRGDRVDAVLAALDLDGDGKLSPKEIQASVKSLRQLDKNRDGNVSADELQSGVRRQD
jgi:hypothetical protein